MSSTSPPNLDAHSLIARIASGDVPREFLTIAARGLLPLPQEELVAILAYLIQREGDEEVQQLARSAMHELPPRVITSVASNPEAQPDDLDYLARASEHPVVLEAIVRNRTAPDSTLEFLARRGAPALQEVIVINQERILRHPAILDALLENPSITADVRRRALETREEFFEKKARIAADQALLGEDLAELNEEQQEELNALLAEAAKYEAEHPTLAELPEGSEYIEPEHDSAWQRILKMTVSQKVQLAFKGGLTERGILIRERNRLICSAVIRGPRVTDTEAAGYAGMRNIDEEVLRLIGMNRQWMAKYSIMIALARNPKAPISVVLPLINRLTLRDLKSLAGDKGVSDAVRQSARRLLAQRKQ